MSRRLTTALYFGSVAGVTVFTLIQVIAMHAPTMPHPLRWGLAGVLGAFIGFVGGLARR